MPPQEAIFGTELATLFAISASNAYLLHIPPFFISIDALMWRRFRLSGSFILALVANTVRRFRLSDSLSLALGRKYYAEVSFG